MCGIVGYVGWRDASEFLLTGLQRLEYRGYDSAGIAVIDAQGSIAIEKTAGRIETLASRLADAPLAGRIGIGHTRWATHGQANEANAHPHLGGPDAVAVVHNGVIENHQALRDRLESEGYVFRSKTDTEVIAHLVCACLDIENRPAGGEAEREARETLLFAVQQALTHLQGTYGLAILFRNHPDVIIAARQGSPLVVGVGEGEHFLASDASPLVGYTDKVVYLADQQVALITADALRVTHRKSGHIRHSIEDLMLAGDHADLDGYPHYMLKEIHEQPRSLENAMRGRLSEDEASPVFGGLNLTPQQLSGVKRILLTGCGTSWHAALLGEYLIEHWARIPVEVEYASELRYRNPPIEPETLVFAISQSGETADTLAALREVKRKGHRALAICNVVGSSIAKEAEGGVYLHAGPEIGVASTKAYTSQCLVLAMLGLYLGRMRHLSYEAGRRMIDELQRLPGHIEAALASETCARRIAHKYREAGNFLYLGRQYNFPTALEGALKLKEISYVHAEGYPAAEMKHGPIALVDKDTPSVAIVPQGFIREKVLANIEEVKARGGPVIAIVEEGDRGLSHLADDVISVPQTVASLQPLVNIIPLQLLAYHIALLRGCDVDKPRNLAKSVTVE